MHHTGHNDKDRARGSIALKGAADSEYDIEKQKDILTMTTTKMKDAEIPRSHFLFFLNPRNRNC